MILKNWIIKKRDSRIKIAAISFFYLFIINITTAQITPWEAITQMQKGINLGNTLEPPYEAGWNNPKAEEYYFDMYKAAGFSCVRIPVRWDNHTGLTSPYKIDEAWLQRVEEIIDWGLDRGLFIIVNSHHDDWIKDNYTDAGYRARFDSLWSQISVRFKDKPEKLIFEILNEPYGLTKEQNDDMHQRVLSIIRKTNPTRIVIFQGHNWGGSDELLTAAIPEDSFMIGSFHSYDPYSFAQLGEGIWGTAGDIYTLKDKFVAVKNWSDEHNIPVILGEFGAIRDCDYNSRMKHYRTYVQFAQTYGFASCAWDDGGNYRIMERETRKWDEVKDILIHTSAQSPGNIKLDLLHDTIIQLTWTNVVSDNDSIFIQRRRYNTNYSRIATLKGDASHYLDINPFPNMHYYYRIIVHYISGDDLYSYPQMIFMPVYVPKIRSPFLGEALKIPGIVEAENFDEGGEGLAYHDADPTNIAGYYRPDEAVEIYDRNGTGYHIGNALPGEWYEYTVDVETEDEYNIDFFLAAVKGGGTFKLKVGEVETDTLLAPTTYSWLNTKSVSTTMNLTAGEQIMRFTVIDDPLFNIDKIVFSLESTSNNPPAIPDQSFIVYQNQYNELVLDLKNNDLIKSLSIYDITGSLVYSVNNPVNVSKISTNQMPAGIYIIQVFTLEHTYTRKVIIN